MKLIFKQNERAIIVEFNKTQLCFSLEKNELNNDDIFNFLTNIAQEISANNFDYKNDIETLDPNKLGELKDLYLFLLDLFNSFIQKYINEANEYEAKINKELEIKKNKINEIIED